jgi:hypothetical protein
MYNKHNSISSSRSNITTIVIIISLIILVLCVLEYITKLSNNKNKKNKNTIEPFDYFTCRMKVVNIDNNFADNYRAFNKKHVSYGPCKDATLYMDVETCPVDKNGSQLPNCPYDKGGEIISSKGNPIVFDRKINPPNISDFFGISM